MRRAAAVAALAVVLPLAGCGGGGKPMTRAAYVAAGTKACSQAAARLRALSDDFRRDPEGTGPKIGSSSGKLLEELLALRPPPELADADLRLESALRNGQDVGQSLARAAARGDEEDEADLRTRLDAAGTRLQGALRAVGLPADCGDAG